MMLFANVYLGGNFSTLQGLAIKDACIRITRCSFPVTRPGTFVRPKAAPVLGSLAGRHGDTTSTYAI